MRGTLDTEGIRRVLYADNLWGFAFLLWVSTGLVRAFAGLEKGSTYYLTSNAFWIKMGLLAVILLLEIAPAITWVRWRIRMARGQDIHVDTGLTNRFATISVIQSMLIIAMIFAASAMARGLGS